MKPKDLFVGAGPEGIRPAQFLAIGGLYVEIQDFVDIWNGKTDVVPVLSPHEIEYVKRMSKGTKGGAPEFLSDDVLPFLLPESFVYKRAEKKKLKGIVDMINRYKKVKRNKDKNDDTKPETLLSMQSVLAAIANNGAKYSTLGEFIATYVASSPSKENAVLLDKSIAEIEETTGEVVAKSSFVNKESAQLVGENIDEVRVQILSEILNMKERKVKQVPVVLLERAALSHPLSEDDAYGLANLRRMKSAIPNVIDVARYSILMTGLLSAGHGLHSTFDMLQIQTGLGITVLGAFLHYVYPVTGKRVKFDLEKSQKVYAKQFKKIKKEIDALKKTGVGNLKAALVREIAISVYSDSDLSVVEGVANWIAKIEASEKKSELFEEYFRRYLDKESFSDTASLKKIYIGFQEYEKEIEKANAELKQAGQMKEAEPYGAKANKRKGLEST